MPATELVLSATRCKTRLVSAASAFCRILTQTLSQSRSGYHVPFHWAM